ncbi:MAG TPA: YeiH family putative sulfate export transporter [Ideonella sp.]|uniref:YeiH family protein n=1 Tax=Ideonella sp. TaxID=1929293 RepID=UPI002B580D2E|nr:YeiH family putative sulfate export transporter [Ideonella sp.]HSI52162.1 YeiH family putative sulfate export transporter [Ideonella sp.]
MLSRAFPIAALAWPRLLPGLLASAVLAVAAAELGRWAPLQALGLGPLTLALLLGLAAGSLLSGAGWQPGASAGVLFSRLRLLRAGVVLYGLRLTLQDVAQVGWAGVWVDALVLTSTFALAAWAGPRMGVARNTAWLIGAGSAICGASAVLATEPLLKARSDQTAVAVACVVLFGTVATLLYPMLFSLSGRAPGFGLFAGATLHEVAQALAVGRVLPAEIGDAVVVAKMLRVMMLAPFLLALAAMLPRRTENSGTSSRLALPWFAFGFIAMVLLRSTGWLPTAWLQLARQLDLALIATAMAALGLATPLALLRRAGPRPLLLAALLFGWLLLGGGLITAGASALLR